MSSQKAKQTENPFKHVTTEEILADLAESRKQIAEGKVIPAEEAIKEIGIKYGFIKRNTGGNI